MVQVKPAASRFLFSVSKSANSSNKSKLDFIYGINPCIIKSWDFGSINFMTGNYIEPNYALPENNSLNPAKKVEIFNGINTSLIAGNKELVPKKSEKIFQNIDNALQNNPDNESTLEIGVVTALLNTNKEKL